MRKGRFPAETVYGPADDAALTSITFGGFFDRGRGHYRDVVVYAVADGPGTLGPGHSTDHDGDRADAGQPPTSLLDLISPETHPGFRVNGDRRRFVDPDEPGLVRRKAGRQRGVRPVQGNADHTGAVVDPGAADVGTLGIRHLLVQHPLQGPVQFGIAGPGHPDTQSVRVAQQRNEVPTCAVRVPLHRDHDERVSLTGVESPPIHDDARRGFGQGVGPFPDDRQIVPQGFRFLGRKTGQCVIVAHQRRPFVVAQEAFTRRPSALDDPNHDWVECRAIGSWVRRTGNSL